MKIFHKVGLLIVSIFLIASFFGVYVSFRIAQGEMRNEFFRRLQALGLSLQLPAGEAVRNYEEFLIQDFVNDVKSEPDVAYAFIVDQDGTIVAHSDPQKINSRLEPMVPLDSYATTPLDGGNLYQISLPIAGGKSGAAVVAVSTASLKESERHLAFRFSLLGIVLLAVFLSVAAVFLRRLLAPIRVLHEGIRGVGEGKFSYVDSVHTSDELGDLSKAFAGMVSQIKRLTDNLADQNAQLEASNKELEAFSYSVSHDLRSPLMAVNGFATVLLEDCAEKLNEEEMDHLKRIKKASMRMGELIDALLKLSRMNSMELRRSRVSLSEMAQEIFGDLQRRDPERKVERHVQEGVEANADPRLARIILDNLLGNAWKYSSKNPEAEIWFGAESRNGEEVYYVRDNGAGFDAAKSKKLFQPFQRFHAKEEFDGTGIGLATVLRVVNRHGGKLAVESETGKGATFYFTLTERKQT